MTPESKIRKQIMDYLKFVPECYPFRVEQRPGMGRGIADIICVYRGRFLAIEVKATGGKPTALQRHFGQQVAAAGGGYFVVNSLDQVVRIIGEL